MVKHSLKRMHTKVAQKPSRKRIGRVCLVVTWYMYVLCHAWFVSYAFHKIYKITFNSYGLTSKSTIFSHAVMKILRRYNVAMPMFNDSST